MLFNSLEHHVLATSGKVIFFIFYLFYKVNVKTKKEPFRRQLQIKNYVENL